MATQSAGILLYRIRNEQPEFFLVHPGGPFWKNKDAGAWSIPKGEFAGDEDPLQAAIREFCEETGVALNGDFKALSPIRQKAGKQVFAWAIAGDIDAAAIKSNSFEMEWPPRSGRRQQFPEVDKAGWFSIEAAKEKILPAQWPLIEELATALDR
ncbi:MAG: NUDIX domain-containing protein [Chitinophagaceae bacterium]|nr:NUDIX domain-containing protein [Chitinophagaceae bacterium]